MMHDVWMWFIENMVDRVSGPMKLRLIVQPTMAVAFAVIGGLRDARLGKTPYFWGLLTDPAHRREMLRDGWKSVGKVFCLAIVLDMVYQFIVERFVHPGEAIIVAMILAIIPYLLVRGVVTRIAR